MSCPESRCDDTGNTVSVLGVWNQLYPVQPGLRDERAIRAFTQGQCHALAFALQEATADPIYLLMEPGCDSELSCQPVSGPDEENSGCCCEIIHFGVMTPSGLWLDITGAQPVTEFLTGWQAQHEMEGLWICPATPQALAWIRRSTRWRPPEVALARSFVAGILAAAQATAPDREHDPAQSALSEPSPCTSTP
jgi:hypothetical protein